jgi:hypothetical protein
VATNEDEREVRALLEQRVEDVQELSWAELDRYGKHTERYTTDGGETYRIVTKAYWDGDDWESGIEIEARAYARTGLRRWLPYAAYRSRGEATDPVGEPPPGWTPSRSQRRRKELREQRRERAGRNRGASSCASGKSATGGR